MAEPGPTAPAGRVRARVAGTLGGGVRAAPPLMRGCRRGARRGTLHLTVVALVSGKEHGTADWAPAAERVAPTVVGAALALVACALTDRAAARRRRLTPPGR
ncbi:hypothetical protein AB0D88_08900 [Streptomyces werraensis]|uniref:hypothetical protein n=1 Tax=Streptomyces werraensis TaxID=68284 RepID=UPI00343C00A4